MHNSYFSLKLNEKCCNRALPLLPSWLSLFPVPTGGKSHFSPNFESSLAPDPYIPLVTIGYSGYQPVTICNQRDIRGEIKLLYFNHIKAYDNDVNMSNHTVTKWI